MTEDTAALLSRLGRLSDELRQLQSRKETLLASRTTLVELLVARGVPLAQCARAARVTPEALHGARRRAGAASP